MSEPQTTTSDPLIDEIRAIRERMSAECNNDVYKLGERLRSLEQLDPGRFLDPEEFARLRAADETSPTVA